MHNHRHTDTKIQPVEIMGFKPGCVFPEQKMLSIITSDKTEEDRQYWVLALFGIKQMHIAALVPCDIRLPVSGMTLHTPVL